MPVPTYSVIADSEIDSESPITESLMMRLRDNVCALFGIDPATPTPSVSLGIRGEIFATRSAATTVGATVTGSAPGPYSWVVPVGVTRIAVEGVGAGCGILLDGSSHAYASPGGDTTLVGSTSSTIVTGGGGTFTGSQYNPSTYPGGIGPDGTGGDGFSSTDHAAGASTFGVAGSAGMGGGNCGFGAKTGYHATGFGGGSSAKPHSAASNIGMSGGGGFHRIVDVVPGETITITIGGCPFISGSFFKGGDGFARIRF